MRSRAIERGAQGAEGTVLAPSAREQTRAVTHVRIRPRARARASPREAGDGRGGQGAAQKPGANAILDKGALAPRAGWPKMQTRSGHAPQAGRRRPRCSRMGSRIARRRVGQAGERRAARKLRPRGHSPWCPALGGGRPDGDGVQRAGSVVKGRGALGRSAVVGSTRRGCMARARAASSPSRAF